MKECPICGGPGEVSKCPGDNAYAATPAVIGLPANWTPPIWRGPDRRDVRQLNADAMPDGVAYDVVGASQAWRIESHGGWIAQVGQCMYMALPIPTADIAK